MTLTVVLVLLALLSSGLVVWQWVVAMRFPLHQRLGSSSLAPGVTLLKPLKGCDAETETCLRSWFEQDYAGPVQLLFGVAATEDPVCEVVRRLIAEHPGCDAWLEVCPTPIGPNAKVSTLARLQFLTRHPLLVVSDADVWAPKDLLANLLPLLQADEAGLACCFYRLRGRAGAGPRIESQAANCDFWSSVLQAASLKPIDFALGAVMALPRTQLDNMGGFKALADYLADDYQLGHRVFQNRGRIALCPVVVECRNGPSTLSEVWRHQLRWSRTIRVCQPLPYFFSILANNLLWAGALLAARPCRASAVMALAALTLRLAMARSCETRLVRPDPPRDWWLAPVKDLLQVPIWALAFMGNRITWRGRAFRVRSGGKLVSLGESGADR
jgi:ceramide glucosyltransferase